MHSKIIAGNWKMNTTPQEGVELLTSIFRLYKPGHSKVTKLIMPPFTHLTDFSKIIETQTDFKLGAQNMAHESGGAFTGEVSLDMLKSFDVSYVIIGHSERRNVLSETNFLLSKKVELALANNMKIIFCVGEKLEDRNRKAHFTTVEHQLRNGLFQQQNLNNVIIAYEPVWAIGTGKTATPEIAGEMHSFIKTLIEKEYDKKTSNNTPVLYGGSMKPENAEALLNTKDIDGGLIGGASLNANSFNAIIQIAEQF